MNALQKRQKLVEELSEAVDGFGLLVDELAEVCDSKALFKEQLDVIQEYLDNLPTFSKEKGAA